MAQKGVVMVIKYTTEHLICYLRKDENGKKQHFIYEKEDKEEPICIYTDRTTMKLSSRVPEGKEETYKYFFELGEIVQFLYDLGD